MTEWKEILLQDHDIPLGGENSSENMQRHLSCGGNCTPYVNLGFVRRSIDEQITAPFNPAFASRGVHPDAALVCEDHRVPTIIPMNFGPFKSPSTMLF
jgi:hypothetical protein